MTFHKIDSRILRVTGLPDSFDGLATGIESMDVCVGYDGETSGRKAIVLDGLVMPLIAAAPELLAACHEAVSALNVKERFKVQGTNSYAIAALCDKAIAKAEGRGE